MAATAKKKAAAKKPATKKKAPARKKTAATKKAPARRKSAASPEQPIMKALKAEHRHIATVMQLFTDQLKAMEDGQYVDGHVVFEIMDYMATWPDRYHHPREDLIYCRVAELDPKAADEVDSLQRDHDHTAARGRELLKEIEGWRNGDVSHTSIVKLGRAYIDHMYEHMNIEEKVVFPHIESILTLEDWRELAEDDQLRAVSDPVFGPRVQREFRNMARKMRRRVRNSVERGAMLEWIGIEALMESVEVLSMAYDSARSTASDHLQAALDDSRDIANESLLSAPVRCAVNNARLGLRFAEEMIGISKETLKDLARVNQFRRKRAQMLDG
jgi:hemerythrin-like domain-containing protein